MIEEININVINEDDLYEKYDKNKISLELLEYIIKNATLIPNSKNIKINISFLNHKQSNLKEMLKEAFKEEYDKTIKIHRYNNILQIFLFILGVLFIFFSTRINESVWKEIFLIGGWVPIWEMIELELFNDFRGHRRKRILLKLLKSEINYQ